MNLRASQALLLGIFAAAGFGAARAFGDTATEEPNPYAVISDRNIFHLNPPPPPPAAEEKPVDIPKVMLNGLLKVGSSTRALLSMPPKDQKDLAKYFNLAPGERENPLELIKINLEKGEADIVNSGTRMTLSLASNGFAASAASSHPAGGAPPLPGRTGLPGIRRTHTLLPGQLEPAGAHSGAASLLPGGNSALSLGGANSGAPMSPGNGFSSGGAIVGGGNSGGGANSGAPSGLGNPSSPGSAIVSGGNAAAGAYSGAPSGSANGSSSGTAILTGGTSPGITGGSIAGTVYIPPNPGSAAANVPGANVGNALMNPNSQYRTPTSPTVAGAIH